MIAFPALRSAGHAPAAPAPVKKDFPADAYAQAPQHHVADLCYDFDAGYDWRRDGLQRQCRHRRPGKRAPVECRAEQYDRRGIGGEYIVAQRFLPQAPGLLGIYRDPGIAVRLSYRLRELSKVGALVRGGSVYPVYSRLHTSAGDEEEWLVALD